MRAIRNPSPYFISFHLWGSYASGRDEIAGKLVKLQML